MALFVRRRFLSLAVLGILGLMVDGVSAAPLRIMPLGDSLTAGNTNAPTWTIPFTFGYRGPLYTLLTDAGYNFQFVGNSEQPWNLPYGPEFGLPTTIQGPDLRTVGQDNHRGYAGWTTSNILTGVPSVPNGSGGIVNWLNADNPDVVLLMIGTNNYPSASAASDLNTLVNTIVTAKPDVQVIVAQIPPRSSYQQSLVNYNSYIKNTMVPAYQAQGKHVTTVDQYVNLLTNENDLASIDTSLYCDSAHMQPTANERLAVTWFAGIQEVAPVPEPSVMCLLVIFGLLLGAHACRHGRRR